MLTLVLYKEKSNQGFPIFCFAFPVVLWRFFYLGIVTKMWFIRVIVNVVNLSAVSMINDRMDHALHVSTESIHFIKIIIVLRNTYNHAPALIKNQCNIQCENCILNGWLRDCRRSWENVPIMVTKSEPPLGKCRAPFEKDHKSLMHYLDALLQKNTATVWERCRVTLRLTRPTDYPLFLLLI